MATGAGALMGAAGACGGGGGGVELHPTNQSAMAQAAKLALLPSLGDAKRATEGCLINGVILKKPSKRWVAFCHCTVWFEQISLES